MPELLVAEYAADDAYRVRIQGHANEITIQESPGGRDSSPHGEDENVCANETDHGCCGGGCIGHQALVARRWLVIFSEDIAETYGEESDTERGKDSARLLVFILLISFFIF